MARTESIQQLPKEEMQLDLSISSNQDMMSIVMNDYNDGRDLVNQLLGQAQMADAFAKFSKTVLTSKMAFVKENKLYQQLKGNKNQDGLYLSGTWAEFCNLLGYTPEHANESIANLNSFGEEALESMSKMGIGYRELRQFRKLPEDEKTALIEVAEAGDKTALLDLAEELIAKQTKEKEALNKQLEETKLDLESSRKVLSSKDAKINELSTQLEKKALIEPPSVDEQIKQLRQEVNLIAFEAESIIRGKLRAGFEKLNSEYGMTEREVMAGWIGNIRSALNQLAGEFDLPEIPEEFAWAKED